LIRLLLFVAVIFAGGVYQILTVASSNVNAECGALRYDLKSNIQVLGISKIGTTAQCFAAWLKKGQPRSPRPPVPRPPQQSAKRDRGGLRRRGASDPSPASGCRDFWRISPLYWAA